MTSTATEVWSYRGLVGSFTQRELEQRDHGGNGVVRRRGELPRGSATTS